MVKLIAVIVLVLMAGGLVVGIASEVSIVSDLKAKFDDMNTDNVEIETAGLDDINLVNLLPLLQIFVGKAASFSDFTLGESKQVALTGLNVTLTLPNGWVVDKDEAGKEKAYKSGANTVIMVKDQDGDSAIITKTEKSDASSAQKFLSDNINKWAFVLETSGYQVDAYTLTLPKGQQARALDVQQNNMAIEVRGWISGNNVYIVNLTSSIVNLPVSEQVFGSIS